MSATISPRLSQLIRRWHAIDADWRQKLAEAERLYGADRETLESVSMAIVDTHADAARSEAMAIAAFPAQSLADIAAKCAFAAKEKDDYELSVATVETTAEDAERLAGEGGASSALVQMAQRSVDPCACRRGRGRKGSYPPLARSACCRRGLPRSIRSRRRAQAPDRGRVGGRHPTDG
jgi:hypothetical protein